METNPWQARNEAQVHHADLVRVASREHLLQLSDDGKRGFWARLFGLRRRVAPTGAAKGSAVESSSVRRSSVGFEKRKNGI